MADILPFRRPRAGELHRGDTLCRNNHHRWATDKTTRFDVERGRLVTVQRCERCGATRTVYT
jgi:hypothetical protein